jgi:hypothetical protein
VHKTVLASFTVFAVLGAGIATAATAQPPSRLERPRLVDQDNQRPDLPRERCRLSDLATASEFAVTNQSMDIESGEVTLGFVAITDNIGRCRVGTSRTKAILTLAGGQWLGQDSVDLTTIAAGAYELVSFSITLPYGDLLDENCSLTRDDWVLTVTSDFLEQVSESNEGNNVRAHTFSTSTDNLCPRDEEEAIRRRPLRPMDRRD